MIWRLVLRQIASYEEIVRTWTLAEVMRANEWIDIMDDESHIQRT